MTDAERKKLCEDLRHSWLKANPVSLCGKAADEIERLAKELANANRLLEINRRRSLEKSGGLEIKQGDCP